MYIKDIQSIERVQKRATKYILNDFTSCYKSRLLKLKLLPLMHWLELQDIMYLVKCLKSPQNTIAQLVSFISSKTRAGQTGRNQLYKTFRNSLPADILDFLASVYSIKQKVRQYLISNFERNFEQSDVCSFHLICPCQNCHTI